MSRTSAERPACICGPVSLSGQVSRPPAQGSRYVVVHLSELNGPAREKWVLASKDPAATGLRLEARLPDGVWIFPVLPDG